LGLGALVTVGFALFFADRREHFVVQGSLIAAISALIVGGLLLVWFLDHPYENSSGSIKPDAMERQLAIVQSEHRRVTPPWDESGHPVSLPAERLDAADALGESGGPEDAAEQMPAEEGLRVALDRVAERRVPGTATLDAATPGDRVVGAHGPARVARLVQHGQ